MRAWLVWLAVACALALRPPPRPQPHRDVATSSGVARGYLRPSPPHYAFLGLPYARAPTGRDRFKAAETPIRWDGVLEATYRVRCAQPGRKGDVACLVLNVFTPDPRTDARPVLVHIHAGHFATGWGSHSAPSRLLSLGFVVVTLNYRLGAEGFLCIGADGAPGNAGLKDQVAALTWVHANIAKFGGDQSQVTLYGTGAGAAAAELLLLSGAIDGFIQRVIMETGSALAPTSLTYDPITSALEVARTLGYEDDEEKTTDDLTTFYQDVAIGKTMNFSNRFGPCIENVAKYYSALLIRDPKEILQSGIFKPVPLLIAYSKERTSEENDVFHNLPNNFEDILPNNLEFESEDMKFRIGEQVKESYFGELESEVDIVGSFQSYVNDVFTVYPIVKSATLHATASNSPVYLMELYPRDESNTIFEYIFSKEAFTEEEELIAEKLVIMWSNFIKYSDPTPLETSLLPVVWLPVTFRVTNEKPDISSASCLMFDLSQISISMGTPSSGNTLLIWDHIYDNFYKSHTPNLGISDSDMAMFNEELAFITTLSQQGSRMEGESFANANGGEKNGNKVNEGERNDEKVNEAERNDKKVNEAEINDKTVTEGENNVGTVKDRERNYERVNEGEENDENVNGDEGKDGSEGYDEIIEDENASGSETKENVEEVSDDNKSDDIGYYDEAITREQRDG